MSDEKDTKKEEAREEEEKTEETSSKEAQAASVEDSVESKEETQTAAPEAAATDEPASVEEVSESEEVEVPEKFQSLVEQIESMSVLELNELVKLLEKKFGVSAVAAAAPAAAAGEGAEEEEKSTATVSLTSAGSQKIGVIKVVKNTLGLGLKEAKDLVDGAPVDLKEEMPKAEAEELKSAIEEAGGSVELK